MIRFLADIPNYDDELKRLNTIEGSDVGVGLNDFISQLFGFQLSDGMWLVLKILLWVGVAVLIGWVVYKEFILPELQRKDDVEDEDYYQSDGSLGTAADADIRGHNFDDELSAALSAGDFALAVNLRYLMALHDLNEYHALQWMEWKTPMMYVAEIQQCSEELRRLTLSFLYIKYGHYPATQEVYDEAVSFYDQLIAMAKGGAL